MAIAERTAERGWSLKRNRWLRILGVAFVMYVLSFIDRVNIAMATPAIRAELGLSPAAIGFAAGFFPGAISCCKSRPVGSPGCGARSG